MATQGQNPFTRRSPPLEGRRETPRASDLRHFARADISRADHSRTDHSRTAASARRAAPAHGERWALSALGSAVVFVLWIVLR